MIAVITILFKAEGQHDHWFVAAWMPLFLALGVGACRIGLRAGSRGPALVAAAGLLAGVWSVALNYSSVNQRTYDLAELYGRTLLEPVDRDAVLVLNGDDPNSLVGYLQRVRGSRPDVALVTASFLCYRAAGGGSDWYDDDLLKRHPFLVRPDYVSTCRKFPEAELVDATTAAFLNANADCGRPLFTDRAVALPMLRPDLLLVPAGALWKVVPRSPAPPLEPRYWAFPIEPEQVHRQIRRERGQSVQHTLEGLVVKPQGYEKRLINLLLHARLNLARALTDRAQFAPAVRLLESVAALDPELAAHPLVIHYTGICYHALGQDDRAEPLLRRSAELGARPEWKATATFYRGEIARKKGDEEGARRLFREALATPGLGEAYRAEIEKRLK
jgi:hypothetical protein